MIMVMMRQITIGENRTGYRCAYNKGRVFARFSTLDKVFITVAILVLARSASRKSVICNVNVFDDVLIRRRECILNLYNRLPVFSATVNFISDSSIMNALTGPRTLFKYIINF